MEIQTWNDCVDSFEKTMEVLNEQLSKAERRHSLFLQMQGINSVLMPAVRKTKSTALRAALLDALESIHVAMRMLYPKEFSERQKVTSYQGGVDANCTVPNLGFMPITTALTWNRLRVALLENPGMDTHSLARAGGWNLIDVRKLLPIMAKAHVVRMEYAGPRTGPAKWYAQ